MCAVIEMSCHRRVLYSFTQDIVMVAIHPKMQRLVCFSHILLTTPPRNPDKEQKIRGKVSKKLHFN